MYIMTPNQCINDAFMYNPAPNHLYYDENHDLTLNHVVSDT